ncbi:hypothetical protein TW85_22425 [Marinomonas sp. S3726]|uniref:inovirus Gp2 family protein n=1 Tax=Marinomonas sp. S3726 TaxID=579484 RepID=UPI0005FA5D90|nr:inovirus Gp2 family protein [Marinomonas sp. S3726]KJZ09289.1 hypothetical protein TW85_22425 [Marinomonas sp. S3726]
MSKFEYQKLEILFALSECNEHYLSRIKITVDQSLKRSKRLVAFRFDLRFPANYQGDTEKVITKFFDSFKAKLKAIEKRQFRLGKRVYKSNLTYIWVRERYNSNNDHFHVVIMLNKDAFHSFGKLNSVNPNLATRIMASWASALSLKDTNKDARGLIHQAKNGMYVFNEKDDNYSEKYEAFFKRLSYFAKDRTKVYGTGRRSFGCSR